MNREIKFRGRAKGGFWHFGDLKLRKDKPNWAAVAAWVVDRETVGEFTGFKDIDGKEIYEGDIIQNDEHPEEVGKVINENGCWIAEFFDDEPCLVWLLENTPQKVIGNAFDNPELLKGSKDND